jgi:hypothetical protein
MRKQSFMEFYFSFIHIYYINNMLKLSYLYPKIKKNLYVGGLTPHYCPSCLGVFCWDCLNPNYDSDAFLGSTSHNSDNDEDDNDSVNSWL